MNNDELYSKATEAIKNLYNDTSVSKEVCRTNLQLLIDEIQTMIDELRIE